ncbi:SNF2-related protein [Calothrix sp. NIES-4071]|nr:SNF2-related protein [Calothrix sp. NIES-4071]BAZ55787.1 SNF2-related protein [Calothrix sp. NIES-4105]
MLTINPSETDIKRKRVQLRVVYEELPSIEKQIVQLFSIVYEPVSKKQFFNCFSKIGAENENYALDTYIDGLVRAELLVKNGELIRCHELLVEIVTRDAVLSGKFEVFVNSVELGIPIRNYEKYGPRFFSNDAQLIREVRIGIYRRDLSFVNQQFTDYEQSRQIKNKISKQQVLYQVCNNPFDAKWIQALPQELYESCLHVILFDSALKLSAADEAFNLIKDECFTQGEHCSDFLRLILVEQLLLRGRLLEAQQCLESISKLFQDEIYVYWGWLSFLRDDVDEAIQYYHNALKLNKGKGRSKTYFNNLSGLFFILALIKEGSRHSLEEALDYCNSMSRAGHWQMVYSQLMILVKVQLGDVAQKHLILTNRVIFPGEHNIIEALFFMLCHYWVDANSAKRHFPGLVERCYLQAMKNDYTWLAMEFVELLSRLRSDESLETQAENLREELGITSIINVVVRRSSWTSSLNALANLKKQAHKSEGTTRLAWFITHYAHKCTLQPREQKVNNKGEWGKGRPIALKRLKNDLDEFNYLTTQDLKACASIEAYYDGHYYGKTEYSLPDKAIIALIGHPLVFWDDATATRVEIVKGEPELIVKKKKDKLTLEFSPKLSQSQNILVIKETPTRIKVIEITTEHRRISEIIGNDNRLVVPVTAEKQVLEAIKGVSEIVTVHSDIGGADGGAVEVPAQTIPHMILLPAYEGLKVSLLSCPFGSGGPYYRPGAGGETVIAEINNQRQQTRRNLIEERRLADNVIVASRTLTDIEALDGEWQINNPEDCLEILLELQALGDSVVIEWPQGEKLRVSYSADIKDFQMSIQRSSDWFGATGELKLDDNLVLDMQQLLGLLDKTSSRFIPLGNGQFLALTQAFRRRLDELKTFSETSSKGVRFHPLATLGLEDFVDEVGKLKADKHWKAHVQRLKEIQNLQPKLPSTFQAELRDYQVEGFNWMSRLAYWGVGACLADQMGLGKTVQALAVILNRATEGATLIIAPTSVCMNWISEAQKFAPTLNIIQFGSGNRQKVLDNLKPFDMFVCSYGLLQQEEVSQMLSQVEWQTIVLDEAQAIKNMTTKRSQAAMNLKAGFKLITTGTPIENHLGELWNLFRFINPGLLGSFESFNERFANPIEKFQDKGARTKLKKLIQPFILRRTKNQVLESLPSRTEILLHVELSREEMAFYEALRREAVAKLTSQEAPAGQKHLQVLAEIMKLRRSCCNARLVAPDTKLPSAKLQLFGEVLEELLENRHKVLVFSQFVDHLHIIRDYLDTQKIKYQYLDGSTPVANRKIAVDAFQAGEGDVFLISLKAGGTGLNLTAADYVIHMDPWWNPAVEDQASDRAHRIGQQRPVTIYRLVASYTIEDKIVELHHHKRDLADSLLEGADISGKMSTEVLLQLMGA